MRVIEKADIAPLEPLLCSIKAGEAILGHSERFIIDAIAKGKIRAVKSGRRTLLVVESVKQYAKSLPRARGTINPPRRHLRQAETATT
jgi:excisionase family DNA binding protein